MFILQRDIIFFVTSLNQNIQLEREYLNENEVSYPLGNIKGCFIQNPGIIEKGVCVSKLNTLQQNIISAS